jgi:hypothetical protein
MNLQYLNQPGLADQDATATQPFEDWRRAIIWIESWQCPHCRKRLGEQGRNSGVVNVITARGRKTWCRECFEKGVIEGICYKEIKLSKAERKKMRRERNQTLEFLRNQKKSIN